MTSHRGRLSRLPRSWAILLLSGHTAIEAHETAREEVTEGQRKREPILVQAFRECLNIRISYVLICKENASPACKNP